MLQAVPLVLALGDVFSKCTAAIATRVCKALLVVSAEEIGLQV